MSTSSAILTYATDNETMAIIAQPETSVSSETSEVFNQNLENTIVTNLFINATSVDIESSNNPESFTVTSIPYDDRQSFDIETPLDVSDISFAVSSQYDSTIQPAPDSNTINIQYQDVSIDKTCSIIKPTSSFYNSNVAFTFANNEGPFYSTSDQGDSTTYYPIDKTGTIPNLGDWKMSFDENNANSFYNKAINSEYSTKSGVRPIRIYEHTEFNKNYALGMDLLSSENVQNYFTLNILTGEPIATPIPNSGGLSTIGNMSESYRLNDNGFYVLKDSDFSNISSDDYGTIRLQQFADVASVTMTTDNTVNDTITQSDIGNFPVSNANNLGNLPTNQMSLDQFNSMFNRSDENILPNYRYTVTITEAENSGYSPSVNMDTKTDSAETFILDDESLSNNTVYMNNYANGNHSLSFADASLSVVSSGLSSLNNIELITLNSQRENLYFEQFNNGQIKFNINSPTSRYVTDANSNLSVIPNVFYNLENTKEGISEIIKISPYCKFNTQLVMKNSNDVEGSLLKNNNCSLDLYKGGVVNNLFNSSNFSFNATNSDDVFAEVLRINTLKELCSINGFNSVNNDNSLTPVGSISSSIYISNLGTTLSANNIFNNSKVVLGLKNISDLSVYNDAITSGWSLSNNPESNKIASSSVSAFAELSLFPFQNEVVDVLNGLDTIDYTISFGTKLQGQGNAHLTDSVIVNWNKRSDKFSSNSIVLSQEMLTREEHNIVNLIQNKIQTPLTFSGPLRGRSLSVFLVSSARTIKYSFVFPIRVYFGLTMTTPSITVTTNYYILKDDKTGEFLPKSFLQYVTDNSNTNFLLVSEPFTTDVSMNGSLTKNDLCDLSGKVVSTDINSGNVTDLTSTFHVSSMYSITHNVELTNEEVFNMPNDISITIGCDYLSSGFGLENDIVLDNEKGYVIKLIGDYESTYTVDNWVYDSTSISTSTDISSNNNNLNSNILSVSDGYAGISNWSSDYSIDANYNNSTSTILLSIYKTNDITKTTVYSIELSNSTYLISQCFISNVPKDIYRINRWIGNTIDDNTFTEAFIQVDYTYSNESIQESNGFSIDTGIYITAGNNLDSNTFNKLSDIGKNIAFTLKSDSFGVNMIGSSQILTPLSYIDENDTTSILNHTISDNGLTFQYYLDNNDETINFTRKLSLLYYRGYFGPQSVEQIYTLARDTMVATLTIDRTTTDTSLPAQTTQSFNVYQNKEYIVNALESVGNIGLKIKFLTSMLDITDLRDFAIYSKADTVNFTVQNPDASGPYRLPLPSSLDLKTFVLDTFSGNNFNNTGSNLSINSNRIKIRTNNTSNPFDYGSASWSVNLISGLVKMYKNPLYLGNPINIDANDCYLEPDPSKWTELNSDETFTFDKLISSGMSLNKVWKVFTTSTNYLPSISYFVVAPVFIIFTQVTNDGINQLPYTYTENNLKYSYVPVVDISNDVTTYNPFSSKTYNYSDGTDIQVNFNQASFNNITFVLNNPEPLISNYVSSTRNIHTQYGVIEGPLLSMKLKTGLKNQNGSLISTMFDNLPSNRLLNCTLDGAYFFLDSFDKSSGNLVMKLLQPDDINTPYTDLSTSQIFSTNATIPANISIQLDNLFILSTSSEDNSFSLDLPIGAGTKASLYTRHTSINRTNGDVYIRVYKYAAANNVSYGSVLSSGNPNPNTQAVSLIFMERSYKEIVITGTQISDAMLSESNGNLTNVFDSVVSNTVNTTFDTLSWINDTDWPTDNSIIKNHFVSLICYNNYSMSNIPPQIFSNTFDGFGKAVYVTKSPLISVIAKNGMPNFSVTFNGGIKCGNITATNIKLNDTSTSSISSSGDDASKYSLCGYNFDEIFNGYQGTTGIEGSTGIQGPI